jgi:hypothetical protein
MKIMRGSVEFCPITGTSSALFLIFILNKFCPFSLPAYCTSLSFINHIIYTIALSDCMSNYEANLCQHYISTRCQQIARYYNKT